MLGKGDFKALLKWRLKMREYREALLQAARAMDGQEGEEGEEGEADEEGKGKKKPAAPKSAVEEEVRLLCVVGLGMGSVSGVIWN